MVSLKPRIQGYIRPDLYEQWIQWKEKCCLESDSQALNELLHQFFNPAPEAPNISSEHSGIESLPGIEARIIEAVSHEIGSLEELVESNVDCAVREAILTKLPTVDQVNTMIDEIVAQRLTEQGRDWIDQLGERLNARMYQIENRQSELEGQLAGGMGDRLKCVERKQEEILAEIDTVIAGEKSLLSSLTVKVMSLQTKIDGLKLTLSSSKLSGELEGDSPEVGSELEGELEGELEEQKLMTLSRIDLAKRLDVDRSTLSRKRKVPGFSGWCQERDPEALAWEYDAEAKLYRQKSREMAAFHGG